MLKHQVGTREQWLTVRRELLGPEKELARRSDELARERQQLPWARVDTSYTFDINDGTKTLAELFDGRSQLLTYHLMSGRTTACRASAARTRPTTSMAPFSISSTTT